MLNSGIAGSYISYLLKAKTRHGIHSPFMYDFVTQVLNDNNTYEEYKQIDEVVRQCKRSEKTIETTDFGAGSDNEPFKKRSRKISDIAASSGISKKMGRLLFRLVRYYRTENILELGTSLGISTMYLALANPEAKVTTIEGCENNAELAKRNFGAVGINNIESVTGNFREVLGNTFKTIPRLDFAFIDGDHREESTFDYFETCLTKAHNDTIMVFDDIYWSRGMTRAWKKIKKHQSVSVSIDLFRIGIVFFRKELSKEDFVLRAF